MRVGIADFFGTAECILIVQEDVQGTRESILKEIQAFALSDNRIESGLSCLIGKVADTLGIVPDVSTFFLVHVLDCIYERLNEPASPGRPIDRAWDGDVSLSEIIA
jgi:hypothetical protein